MFNRVLIVDELPTARTLLRTVIKKAFEDCEIFFGASLTEGLHQLESVLPDLLLVDLSLPDGSGIDLIRAARKSRPRACLLVTTIYDDDQHVFPSLRAGAHGYILKQDSEADLIDALRTAARGGVAISRKRSISPPCA